MRTENPGFPPYIYLLLLLTLSKVQYCKITANFFFRYVLLFAWVSSLRNGIDYAEGPIKGNGAAKDRQGLTRRTSTEARNGTERPHSSPPNNNAL